MKLLWKLFLLCPALTTVLPAQDITGDWLGTLKTPGPELRIALHITKTATGALDIVFQSVDQNATLQVSSISLQDSTLKFSVDQAHGAYAGKVNADASAITGAWTQGQSMPLNFQRGVVKTPKPAQPSDIDGTWSGLLDFGAAKLHIVYHILNTEDGLTATADSPDQGAKGMPVAVTRDGASLKLEMKGAGAVFTGAIAADKKSIAGTFVQGPNNIPLTLTPLKDSASLEPRRPQNPVKPYPYREEDVVYDNTVQNVRLAATLTLPAGKGPFPAVVLITGSGPQDRDETVFAHKPFLVLADHLARRGIAVLRADDRGIGKSTGNFSTATTADFATDAEAGIAYLKTRSEINPHKIGLIGHSEGGIIAPMIAARNPDVAFIVMLAGTGVRGEDVIVSQTAALNNSGTKEGKEKAVTQEREILELAQSDKDGDALAQKLRETSEGKSSDEQIAAQLKQLRSPWFLYFIQFDPATALRKVTCPVLALNGEKDLQVDPKQNLPAIRKALEQAGNTHFEVVELPSLNHLFQTAKTGSIDEYAQIEETFSPTALNKISSWIQANGTGFSVPTDSSIQRP